MNHFFSKKLKIFALVLLLAALLASAATFAEDSLRVEGFIYERGTRKPLAGVRIFVLPQKLKATTDEQGHFLIEDLAPGPFEWIVNSPGYQKLDQGDEQNIFGPNEPRHFYLEREDYQVYETTVFGKGDKEDDAQKTLTNAQFMQLPGSNGDPVKGLQNLPGVARPGPLLSEVIIEGSAPEDTRYTIDGHEVPLIFHFGGLSSVVLPEAVGSVDYLTAGYGPEWGRAEGGLVGIWVKDPLTDRMHGFAYVDTYNAGGMVEGPAGKSSSYLFGLRQSYIGELFKVLAKNNQDFNFTVAPDFKDLIGEFETELTPIDHFKLVTVGSSDTLEFVLSHPANADPSIRGTFDDRTSFVRVIPEWTHKNSEDTQTKASLGIGRDWLTVDIGTDYFKLQTVNLTPRAEVDHRFSNIWTSQIGTDDELIWANVQLLAPSFNDAGGVSNPFGSGNLETLNSSPSFSLWGIYWRNEVVIPNTPFTLLPGARVDYFTPTSDVIPQPRMSVRYKVDDSLSYHISGGLYAQPAQPQESDPSVGNPNINDPRAWHLALGVDKDFRGGTSRGLVLSGGPFYRYFENVVEPTSDTVVRNGVVVPEYYDNSGKGRAYGIETLLKVDLAPWQGWLAYTLSKSVRWTGTQGVYPFEYDQTHLLTAVAARDLGRNWKISGRARYVTGNPYTPVTGSEYDSDNDVYFPIRGPYYSDRLSPFFQIDMRVDKKWIYEKWILSAYLDIQNVTNHQNVEAVQYSYDYKSNTTVTGLPFFPTFGLKGEF